MGLLIIMITKEKIKIFDHYKGDMDSFIRSGSNSEQELWGKGEWSLISSFYQDIVLINKGLATQAYTHEVFIKLKANCDRDSFDILVHKIEYYKDFQEVAAILKQIKSYTHANAYTDWTYFDSATEFIAELDQDIAGIEHCDFATLDKVNIEFLPTATYQEMSMSNGWSKEYLQLSGNFDILYQKLTKRKTAHNSSLPKVKKTWWKTLFGFK